MSSEDPSAQPTRSVSHIGPPPDDIASRVGETIDHYTLLELLGQGGMGAVFRARQNEPVQREVALKVIKLGMDTVEVVSRFQAERQALAVMDHPNIAHVYDAGATRSGRPYFVMELVHGKPITTYCDQRRLSTRRRLELFLPVCEAVQHAHLKGVIHRDLKPSNILVDEQDGQAHPKVIDFGVAKATRSNGEEAKVTRVGALIGTPEFMSPEQADLSGMDVDTRTDVYSLGATLYELLTGLLPFGGEIRSLGFVEMSRAIRETEPPRPSQRVGSLAPKDRIPARRGLRDPGELRRLLGGDLDWIVMMALEKDRGRRYQTAAALALDIRRYLDREPIAARPPSALYRARRFVQRNGLGVGLAALTLLALLAGTVGTGLGFVRARSEAAKAREVSAFVTGMLSEVHPESGRGREVTVRQALDAAAKKLEGQFATAPAIEAELRHTIGEMYSQLGYYDEARPLLERALVLYRQTVGERDIRTLKTHNEIAIGHFRRFDNEEAAGIWRRLLERYGTVFGESHAETLTMKHNLGAAYLRLEDYELAEPLIRSALEGRRELYGAEDSKTLGSLGNLATLYQEIERHSEAEPLFAEILELRRGSLGDSHPRTLISVFNLADLYRLTGRARPAEPLMREALEGFDRAFGDRHPYTLLAQRQLADILLALDRPKEAASLADGSYALHVEEYGEEHEETLAVAELLERIRGEK